MAAQDVIRTNNQNSPLDQVPGLRQFALLLAIAGAVAVGVWSILWLQEDEYSVLFSNLDDADAAAVVEALDAVTIKHRYRAGSGTVLVPSDELHSARLQLASRELPAVGGDVGFEMFRETNGISDSQFIESAKYQRALEVELQRTISNIRAVRGARVHLAVPRDTVFIRDRKPASASVLLELYGGRDLGDEQTDSIVNLVASSVPDMETAQVSVIDQDGNHLSAQDRADEDAPTAIERRRQRLEARYAERIEAILTPLVGRDGVRAQVAVRLDPTQVEETREVYDDENQVVRSEEITEQIGRPDIARGIPGALSNQPPVTPEAAEPGDQAAAQGPEAEPEPGQALPRETQALRNFEIGRSIQHIQQSMGGISRISAAVIVDEKQVENAEGEIESVAYSQQEVDRMVELVRQVIGFDEARNDRVSVVNAPFQLTQANDDMDIEEPSFLDRLDVAGLARTAAVLLLLLVLLFAVIRPTLRQLVMTLPPRTVALPPASPQQLSSEDGQEQDSQENPRAEASRKQADPYQEKVTTARNIVKEDPKRVAQVVKQWVSEDGG